MNAKSHHECNKNKIICDKTQKASCMIEIRNGGHGELISKGCKQINACVNNNSNPNSSNCCCTGDHCNRNGTTCANSNTEKGTFIFFLESIGMSRNSKNVLKIIKLIKVILGNGKSILPKWKSYHSETGE